MTNKQLTFSLLVGVFMVILGGVIATEATVGIGLGAIGATIVILAALTRRGASQRSKMASLPASAEAAGAAPKLSPDF